MGEELAKEEKEAAKFVIPRMAVLFENIIEQVNNEDKFDYFS